MTGENMKSDLLNNCAISSSANPAQHLPTTPENKPKSVLSSTTSISASPPTPSILLHEYHHEPPAVSAAINNNLESTGIKSNLFNNSNLADNNCSNNSDRVEMLHIVVNGDVDNKKSAKENPPPPPVEEITDVKQLKELLLLHLDMIQHQQQLLIARDQQIKSLSTEKENLMCRLERMERRLAVLKKEQGIPDTPEKVATPRVPTTSATPEIKTTTKRKSEHGHWSSKRSASARLLERARSNQTPSSSVKKRERFLNRRRLIDERNAASTSSPTIEVKVEPSSSSSEVKHESVAAVKRVVVGNDDANDSNILRAGVPYYVPYEEYSDEETADDPKPTAKVEVPSWRFHPISNSWTLEGTENLEDEVYIKRHQKPEVDEKRRKRWDIQRLREQKIRERLKSGRSTSDEWNNPCCKETFNSFHPDVDDVLYIEVNENLPVSAFGYPVIKIPSQQFHLPWRKDSKPDTAPPMPHRKPGRPRRT